MNIYRAQGVREIKKIGIYEPVYVYKYRPVADGVLPSPTTFLQL